MKRNILKITLLTALAITGCKAHEGSGEHSHAHSHEHSEKCAHSHGAHDEHEGHDHEGHAHEGHDEHHDGEIKFTKAQAEAVGLETEIISPAPFRAVIHTAGRIVAPNGNEQRIVATSSGVLHFANSSITEGTHIKKGEKIAFVTAEGLQDGDPAVKAKAVYEAAEKEYRRAEKLVADKIISEKEFEQARLNYETARAAYESQAADFSGNGVTVKAQKDGYISALYASEGEYVTAGQTIATVLSNGRVQLSADLPEREFRQLTRIRDANFSPAYDEGVYSVSALHGHIVSIGSSVAEGSAYIPVTFEFENHGGFIPGTFADVWLLTDSRENALSVPVSAIAEDQGIYSVFVRIEPEAFRRQEVGIGESDGLRVEVLSGLKDGEEVVTRGTHQVKLASASTAIPGHTHNH